MQHRINKECLLHVLVKNHKKPEQLTSYCTAEFGKSMTGNVSMCKDSDCFWDSARLCCIFSRGFGQVFICIASLKPQFLCS